MGFFDVDGDLHRILSKATDFFVLNMLFLAGCVPLFTIGASVTAMYTVLLRQTDNRESYLVRGFLQAYKDNFKKATALWIFEVIEGMLIFYGFWWTAQFGGFAKLGLYMLLSTLALCCLFAWIYVFAVQSRFENTLRNTIRNAFLMAVGHLPYTILILFIDLLPIAVILFVRIGMLAYILPVFLMFGFSVTGYLNCKIFHRIFQRYIPQDEENLEEDAEGESL